MSARSLTCRELIEFLAAYLDAELPPVEHAAFEAHLALCPDCVDYLASYRETIRLGTQALADETLRAEDVPAELVDAILAARTRR
jgi:anti-sigma factor RsiW